MKEQEQLRIRVSEQELERLWKAAKAQGAELEDWVREILLRAIRERDDKS